MTESLLGVSVEVVTEGVRAVAHRNVIGSFAFHCLGRWKKGYLQEINKLTKPNNVYNSYPGASSFWLS